MEDAGYVWCVASPSPLSNSVLVCLSRGKLLFNPFDVVDDAAASLDDFDPELRMIFKRILKKEQSTRTRGLQEFRQWLETCTGDDFANVRELFVTIYRQGVEDQERSIRELVNGCLQTIVERDKKWLSPIFKGILYAWIGNFADVGPVARAAKASFQACFGEPHYPKVCRIAAPVTIPEALSALEKDGAAISSVHAFSNLLFIISFADTEVLEQTKADFAASQAINANVKMMDPSAKMAAYQFYRLALQKNVLQGDKLLTAVLFRSLLNDLNSVVSSEALALLCMYEDLTRDMIAEVASAIKANLHSEIHESIIGGLAVLLNRLPLDVRTSVLWSVLTERKILDSERLVRIWSLFASCCLEKTCQESDCCSKLLYPGVISKGVRARVIEKISLVNKQVFKTAFSRLLEDQSIDPSYKLQLALEIAPIVDNDALFDRQELFDMMRDLPPDQQSHLVGHILESPKGLSLHKLLLKAASDALDFVAMYSSGRGIKNPDGGVQELLAGKIQGQLEGMDIDEKIKAHAATAKLCNSFADVDTILYALDHMSQDSARVVMAYFGEAFWGHFGREFAVKPETLCLLRTLAKDAILNADGAKTEALFTLIDFTQGGLHSPADILATVDYLFDIDPSLHSSLIDKILALDYSLNEKIMRMFHRAFPGTMELVREHVTLKSVALTEYPALLSEASSAMSLWTGDMAFLRVLDPLLRHAARNGDASRKDEILLYNAFLQCMRGEGQFRPLESQCAAVLPSPVPLGAVDIDKMACTEGFCLLSARDAGASLSLSKLLSPAAPLSLSMLPVTETRDDRKELLESVPLAYEPWLKLLAAKCDWCRDEYYQLLSEREYLLAITRCGGILQGILADFMNAALTKGLISSEEYWEQHVDIMEGLIANLRQLWDNSNSRLANHSAIYSTLRLFDLPQMQSAIPKRLELITEGFASFAREPTLFIFGRIVSQCSRLLTTCTDRPQLLGFISDGALIDVLLESLHLPAKFAARRILLSRSDEFLIKAKHTIETLTSADADPASNGQILMPSEALAKVLKRPQEFSDINAILALDIFLSLAEGSKEESRLFTAYAEFFREQAVSSYLSYLCRHLNWDTDSPIDLSRMEITVLALEDNNASDLVPYAANVLFRGFKNFPMAVRSWYDELSKEWSARVLKYTTQFLSPLLIERELARIRKASLEPIKLRIIQSSTTCAVQVNYHLEEFQLSYTLTIPLSYPLKPIAVQGSDQQQRLGISAGRWRTWLLSVQSLLAQNLAIIDVIRQWKSNAEKVLQGIEPCSVCYCVLQPSDRSLPGPNCKTCRNKFHSMCLYRWFKTSGQATCPMCRSLF